MTSHEYAKKLHDLANNLEHVEPFLLPNQSDSFYRDYGIESFRYYGEKLPFLAAVKAVGTGKKDTSKEREFSFIAFDGLLHIVVNRDAVCRIVKPAQPAEYDCEPLLSQEEEDSLEQITA